MHIPSNSFSFPPIAPVTPPDASPIGTASGLSSTQPAGEASFRDILGSAIDQVETSRSEANAGVNRFLAGEGDDLHSTILASQRADLEFQMFMQVRNKVVQAYSEIMRMQM